MLLACTVRGASELASVSARTSRANIAIPFSYCCFHGGVLHTKRSGSCIKRGVGFTTSSEAELESKVNKLSMLCEELQMQIKSQTEMLEVQSRKMDRLSQLMEASGGGGSLLEAEAVKTGITPSRDTFVPTLSMLKTHINHPCQMSNDFLASLAISGDGFAARERLIREIMSIDRCSWDDAHERLIEMDMYNEQYYWLQTLPYRIGITLALISGVGSFCLVFYKPTAQLYAEAVAGETLPEGVEDISTMTTNQVGSWTWTWAEPMIGVASFVLLCMQFARAQAVNMNMSAFTRQMLKWRAQRVSDHFPQYTGAIVRSWAVRLPDVDWTFFPRWKRSMYTPKARKVNYRVGQC